ncbi:hypothetical protein T4C_5080 [Trichinella pseudospiralis]|uniref:Uncharacterized protein n=1 Tax=Trichinella pseudospiralis TaxID=6337 RepID=A0A0V1JWF1_TRIPS|nr:hypothetical protein T4C_5080 [Trichinella pseudospiralis]
MMQRANCSQKRSASSIYIITQSNAIEKRGSSMRSRDGILHLFFTVNKLKSTLMLNHGIRRLFMVALGAGTRNKLSCKNAQAADTAVGVRDNLLCFHLVISSFREGF